jgi:hypothetical protein
MALRLGYRRSHPQVLKGANVIARRIAGFLVALLCVGLLSSCSLIEGATGTLLDDSGLQLSAEIHQIAGAVKNHDSTALKGLFSPLARKKAHDLNGGIKYFFSFFPSSQMTYKLLAESSAEDDEHGQKTVGLSAAYKVTADGKEYELNFLYYPVNQVLGPNNVGIYGLGITPYIADPIHATGPAKAFLEWSGSLGYKHGKAVGVPGVYMPKK